MPNLAGVLKDEIRRLARKEVRSEVSAARKSVAQHRKDIAELKRQLRDQQRIVRDLQKAVARAERGAAAEAAPSARFSPKWLAAHRERLGLSAADYASLVGVSALTIYNWEKGRTRPAPQQLEAWLAVRGLGKREALRRLESEG